MLPFLGILLFQACATAPPPPETPVVLKDPFRAVPLTYRTRARQYEKSGNLPLASLCWHIVESFRPGDREAAANTARLRSTLEKDAEQSYVKGVAYFNKKETGAAQNDFLMALFYNPDHMMALDYLEDKLSPPDFITYRIQKGDTPVSVARKLYRDREKKFMVAYFNNSGDTDAMKPGDLLELPILEPAPSPKKAPAKTLVQEAQSLFKAGKYREAISLAENIVAYGPSSAARKVINASYYALAMDAFHSGRLPEAMKLFGMVNSDYEKTSDYIRRIRNQLRVRADYHYKKGAQYFVDENLAKAIFEWEITLRLNPEHAKARADLKKARTMLKNLNGMQ
jgi:tetratricopeptide (TPR) repeat protein